MDPSTAILMRSNVKTYRSSKEAPAKPRVTDIKETSQQRRKKQHSFLGVGDAFSGYQKSLSKKSEYFFTELEVNLTDVDASTGLISGLIDKKVISITGKKHLSRVFFDGQLIDGEQHSFTSELSAGCEALDVYFWNRFPSFKEIESMRELKGEHGAKWVYMRWTERGEIKTKRQKKKVSLKPQIKESVIVSESESDLSSSDVDSISDRALKHKKAEKEEELLNSDEDEEEDDFELIEYLDEKTQGHESELNPTGQYFVCYDVVQDKLTGYYKQAFMKNCQKMILERKALGHQGHSFGICERM